MHLSLTDLNTLGRIELENALRSYGVTEKETEVYLFLVKKGAQKASQITRALKKNKGQIYRILKNLQNKDLIESTLEYPTRYVAVPLERVIDSFIKSKKEEFIKIKESKSDLISDWKKISQSEVDTSVEKFSVIEGSKKIFQRISQMIKQTKNLSKITFRVFPFNSMKLSSNLVQTFSFNILNFFFKGKTMIPQTILFQN